MTRNRPVLITDARPSLHDDQARRRRTYVWLMAVHIVGFALSYPLYEWQWWAGVLAVLLTGSLPWVAVLVANDAPRRTRRRPAARIAPRSIRRGSRSALNPVQERPQS